MVHITAVFHLVISTGCVLVYYARGGHVNIGGNQFPRGPKEKYLLTYIKKHMIYCYIYTICQHDIYL